MDFFLPFLPPPPQRSPYLEIEEATMIIESRRTEPSSSLSSSTSKLRGFREQLQDEEEEAELNGRTSPTMNTKKLMGQKREKSRKPISQWNSRRVVLFLVDVARKHRINTNSNPLEKFNRVQGHQLASFDEEDFENIVGDPNLAKVYFEATQRRSSKDREETQITVAHQRQLSQIVLVKLGQPAEEEARGQEKNSRSSQETKDPSTEETKDLTTEENTGCLKTVQHLVEGEKIIFVVEEEVVCGEDEEVVCGEDVDDRLRDRDESDDSNDFSDDEFIPPTPDSESESESPIMTSSAFIDYAELCPLQLPFDFIGGDTSVFHRTTHFNSVDTSSFIDMKLFISDISTSLVDNNNNNDHNMIDDSSLPDLELLLPRPCPPNPPVTPASDEDVHSSASSNLGSPPHYPSSFDAALLASPTSPPHYFLHPPPLTRGINVGFENGSHNDNNTINNNNHSNNAKLSIPKTCQSSSASPPASQSASTPEKNHRGRSRTARSLWQFILDLLDDEVYNPSTISWIDQDSMEFKVNNTQKLGILWGREKDNPTMNFDKLSRAIRFYYGKNVFQPVTNKRLIYKFGETVRSNVKQRLIKRGPAYMIKQS